MRILIVEDDFSFAVNVEMLIEQLGYIHLGTVDNGEEALAFIQKEKPDLILMDIDLNGFFNGIDIARKITHLDVPLIFMTTFNDEQVYKEAMLTNPYGYLVKPFDQISLRSQIERIHQQNTDDKKRPLRLDDCFFVKVNEVLKRINYDDVLWIQSDRNYVDIYIDGKRFSAKISLSKLETQLNAPFLFRVHKQYIINLKKVEGVTANDVLISSKPIPIGNTYKEAFFKTLNRI